MMEGTKQTGSIEYPGGSIHYVKQPTNPALDSFEATRTLLKNALLTFAGTDTHKVLSQLVERPAPEIIERLTNNRLAVSALLKLAVVSHRQRELQSKRIGLREEAMKNRAGYFGVVHGVPAISAVAAEEKPWEAIDEFTRRLPFSQTLNAMRIRRTLATDYGKQVRSEVRGGHEGMPFFAGTHHAMEIFNQAVFDGSDYTLQMIEGSGFVGKEKRRMYTPGLVKIHAGDTFAVRGAPEGDDEISYAVVSIVYPTGLAENPGGLWQADARRAIVFRDTIESNAAEYAEMASGILPNLYNAEGKALVRYVTDSYGGPELATMLERSTLCEEVKHGINCARRGAETPLTAEGDVHVREQYRLFNNKRLSAGGFLRASHEDILAESVDDGDSHSYRDHSSLEECNAKLTEIAVGPDPQYSMRLALSNFTAGVASGETLDHKRSDNEALLLLLCDYSGGSCGTVGEVVEHIERLCALPKGELRLLAKRAFEAEFDEVLEDTPFCVPDVEGKLVRHPGTRDDFAAWAD